MSANITLVGRLGGDPELRFTASGKAVANFSLVTDKRRKNEQTQEWESTEVTWWRCAAWGPQAENVAESLQKGDEVVVVGRTFLREYENRDGTKGKSLDVDAYTVGPSLKYATAKVNRAARGTTGGGSASAERDPWAPSDDPWAGSSEPPF